MTDFLPRTRYRPKRFSARQMVVRWTTLLVFSGGTLGLPLDLRVLMETDAETRATAKPSCRCSLLARKSRACCCQKTPTAIKLSAATVPSLASSCCKTIPSAKMPPLTANRSGCCKSRPAKTAPLPAAVMDHSSQTAEASHQSVIDACPCGLSDDALLFVCGEPRVLPDVAESPRSVFVIERLVLISTAGYGLRLPPDVPPPKSLALRA